jgi:hemoglobin
MGGRSKLIALDLSQRAATLQACTLSSRPRLTGPDRPTGFHHSETLREQMTDNVFSDEERRALIVQQMREQTGIDENMIDRLVRGFYARIRQDALLGPIFNSRIQVWEPHLQRMCAFWSSVVLSSGMYHGQPMRMHLPLPVEARHFDRWLALFEQTAKDLFNDSVAELFIDRARRIAMSLELGIASSHGVLLGKGERFRRQEQKEDA